MIDRALFEQIIMPLGKVFKPLPEASVDVYFDRLKWGNEGTLRWAVERLLDTHKFQTFPLIEEFKDAIAAIDAGAIDGTEEDYRALDKDKCPACSGQGRVLVYLDEYGRDVGWERRNEPGIRVAARFCQCWFGKRIYEAQRTAVKRNQEKKQRRWVEPGEDRDDQLSWRDQ